jgi:hypothetical protein
MSSGPLLKADRQLAVWTVSKTLVHNSDPFVDMDMSNGWGINKI